MSLEDEVRENLQYDPDTGDFRWKKPGKGRQMDRSAGTIMKFPRNSYRYIWFQGKSYRAHRLSFLIMEGKFPEIGMDIDHINGNGLDNRWKNLQVVTRSQNLRKQRKRLNNNTGYKGVSWYKRHGKFRSRIRLNGRMKHLGYYDTAEEAHAEYCRAADRFFGEFSNYG